MQHRGIRGVLDRNPQKKHIITARVEHEAVRNLCALLETQGHEVTWLEVDGQRELNLDDLRAALRSDTALVSVMLANNETGVLFSMAEIGGLVHENSDAIFHVDGVQAGPGGSPAAADNGSSVNLQTPLISYIVRAVNEGPDSALYVMTDGMGGNVLRPKK